MKEQNLPLKNACLILGSQTSMAKYLSVSPPTINQWIKGIRPLPAERCPEIEKATKGAVTCEELRPDVDWAYLRGTRANNAYTHNNAA